MDLSKIMNESTDKANFEPSYFEVYDKSTENFCNRLIIVQPFSWYILARNGNVYVITDMQFNCPIGTTTATKLHRDQDKFMYTCLNGTLNVLIDSFKKSAQLYYKEIFDIENLQSTKGKFTVLDALNYLFTKYINITNEEDDDVDLRYNNLTNPVSVVKTINDKFTFDISNKKKRLVKRTPISNYDITHRQYKTVADRLLSSKDSKGSKFRQNLNKLQRHITNKYGKPDPVHVSDEIRNQEIERVKKIGKIYA